VDLAATAQRLTRIDYLDGLGVAVGLQEVAFVHVAKRFLRVSLRHARTLPLPVSGNERTDAFNVALTQFLEDIDVTPDQIVLCLPRHSACVSRLIVPETARGSLRQIIDYEVERLLPFPKEEIYYDFLTYDIGGEERRIGVMIFCLPRREVDQYLELLTHAQVRPQMITLSTAAVANTLAFCDLPAEVPRVVVSAENGEVELCFVENKRIAASLLFPRTQVQEQEGLMDLLSQGVARALPGTSLSEVEIFTGSGNGALPFPVEGRQDLSPLLLPRLTRTEEEPWPVGALPALGAALQAVGEATVEVNVLPLEKRGHREKRLSPLTLVLAGLILLLGAGWAVGVVVQERRILGTLTQAIAALDPEVRQVQAQEEEASRLKERLRLLEETTRRRLLPLLGNLSDLVPTDVYLTNFRYKDGNVELSGVATRSASDLVALLEGSPCLRNVAPKAPFTKTANGETFTLGAQVEPCG
jgi:Tfp pilus assembly protein PilN